MQEILKELRLLKYFSSPTLIKEDNQGTIAVAKNPDFHRQTKHIDIQYYWIRDAILWKLIAVKPNLTWEQAADRLIKALIVKAFQEFEKMVGMVKRVTN